MALKCWWFVLELKSIVSLFLVTKVSCREGKESVAMKELFKVMKDYSNGFMQDLVTSSFQHYFISEARTFLEDPDDIDIEGCGTQNVVCVCVVQSSFKSVLSDCIAKIQGAKLILDRFGFDGTTQAHLWKDQLKIESHAWETN